MVTPVVSIKSCKTQERKGRKQAERYRGVQAETSKTGGEQARGHPCRKPWLFPQEEAQCGNGWFNYWTGELNGSVSAKIVNLNNGNVNGNNQDNDVPVAVCRR